MSSKFKDLMAQARSRQEESPEDHAAANAGAAPISTEVTAGAVEGVEEGQGRNPSSDALTESVASLEQPMSVAKKRGRPRGKRSHPDFEQVSAYISKNTYRSVKIALLQEGQSREFSELVEELLSQWLQK